MSGLEIGVTVFSLVVIGLCGFTAGIQSRRQVPASPRSSEARYDPRQAIVDHAIWWVENMMRGERHGPRRGVEVEMVRLVREYKKRGRA